MNQKSYEFQYLICRLVICIFQLVVIWMRTQVAVLANLFSERMKRLA